MERNNTRLAGWTKEEKLRLYQAIRAHGSHSIEEIQECIPHKSKEAIEEAIFFFKSKALKQENHSKRLRERKRDSNSPSVPLNSWAKLLTETFPFNELRTETATALRLIADFENIPKPVCTERIDFRKIYHTIANALEGKALCEDQLVAAVLDKCLIETALTSKAFMRGSSYKTVLKDIRIKEQDLSTFLKPTENNELTILRRIMMSKNFNPLNITEPHLKFSLFP